MKFGIKNLGPIKEAEIELGDLTIICGKNNSGKTYLVYTLYSFLKFMPKQYVFPAFHHYFDTCYKEGGCHFDAREVFASFSQNLSSFIENFKKFIPSFLAMSHDILSKDIQVFASIEESEFQCFISKPLEGRFQVTEKCTIVVEKKENSQTIAVRIENMGERLPRKENLRQIFDMICSFFFNAIFPDAFSLTGERSGISIFADNIADFSRKISNIEFSKKRRKFKATASIPDPVFPLPVLKEVEFFQNLKKVRRKQSFLVKDNPHLLQIDDDLFGGRYDFDDQVGVQYFPENSANPLTLPECSSSVKSLVEFNFYLRHCAKKQQILMIDEPELNLHPGKQRQLARFLGTLVNAGIKVFISTHSDYIIRELNTLIMLHNSNDPRLQQIAKDLGYAAKDSKDADGYMKCLLDPDQVRCYVAKDGTVVSMDISTKFGIEVTSFDDSIREFNALQKKILYGE